MKREFIKCAYATLVSKLVLNKRHSLYGLMSKTPPPSPQPQINTKTEEEPHLELQKHHRFFCCFNVPASEPELSILTPQSFLVFLSSFLFSFVLWFKMAIINNTSPTTTPPITPRDDVKSSKRPALRRLSSAVGLVELSGLTFFFCIYSQFIFLHIVILLQTLSTQHPIL